MKDLQMLIDKWKKEADELDAVMKDVDFTMFAQLLGTVRRLRFCAVDVELLIGKMANNELSPQLNKHDVSGRSELLLAFLQYVDTIDLVEYDAMSHEDLVAGFKASNSH